VITRKVKDHLRTAQEELVYDLKAVGTTVTKQTIGNALRCIEVLKPCRARKVPLLKKAQVQAHLKFAKKHLMIQRRLGRKCGGQIRPNSSSLASTHLTENLLPSTRN